MICRIIKTRENVTAGVLEETKVVIERSETARTELLVITCIPGEISTLQNTEQKEQLYFILEGKGRIEAVDFSKDVKSGNYIYLPAHLPYKIIVAGEKPLICILFNAYLDDGIKSERKPLFVDNIESRRVYDFGSNLTTMILDRADTEQCEATIVSWPPHQKGAIVAHNDKEQTFYVLSGSGTVMIDNETDIVKPGDVIFVPFYTPHTTESGEEALTYLCFNTIVTSKKYASFDEMYHIVIKDRLSRWKEKDKSVGL